MIARVPLEIIDDNPFQSRAAYGDVAALAAEIERHGLLQAPRGRIVDENGNLAIAAYHNIDEAIPAGLRVQLAFGHRRLRAMKMLARSTHMPVEIRLIPDEEMIDSVWSENANREDFNPIERAELMATKLERFGGTHLSLAEEWGLARATVSNSLRLLELPDDVKAAVREGRLSERQAIALIPAIALSPATNRNDDADIVTTVLENPEQMTSDVIRKYVSRTRRPRPAVKEDSIPMLKYLPPHAALSDLDAWPLIEKGAMTACRKCIEDCGPPVERVCRQCPGVTLINAIARG